MLQLLSQLQVGQTINIKKLSISEHRAFSTSAYRWWYREDRWKTYQMIENCLYETIRSLQDVFKSERFEELRRSIQGLESLIKTYISDHELVQKYITLKNHVYSYVYAIKEGRSYDLPYIEQKRDLSLKKWAARLLSLLLSRQYSQLGLMMNIWRLYRHRQIFNLLISLFLRRYLWWYFIFNYFRG